MTTASFLSVYLCSDPVHYREQGNLCQIPAAVFPECILLRLRHRFLLPLPTRVLWKRTTLFTWWWGDGHGWTRGYIRMGFNWGDDNEHAIWVYPLCCPLQELLSVSAVKWVELLQWDLHQCNWTTSTFTPTSWWETDGPTLLSVR